MERSFNAPFLSHNITDQIIEFSEIALKTLNPDTIQVTFKFLTCAKKNTPRYYVFTKELHQNLIQTV